MTFVNIFSVLIKINIYVYILSLGGTNLRKQLNKTSTEIKQKEKMKKITRGEMRKLEGEWKERKNNI